MGGWWSSEEDQLRSKPKPRPTLSSQGQFLEGRFPVRLALLHSLMLSRLVCPPSSSSQPLDFRPCMQLARHVRFKALPRITQTSLLLSLSLTRRWSISTPPLPITRLLTPRQQLPPLRSLSYTHHAPASPTMDTIPDLCYHRDSAQSLDEFLAKVCLFPSARQITHLSSYARSLSPSTAQALDDARRRDQALDLRSRCSLDGSSSSGVMDDPTHCPVLTAVSRSAYRQRSPRGGKIAR